MCGIAGAMRRDGGPVSAALLQLMCQAQAHRGPDGQGSYFGLDVGLAHQRLAIVDLVTGDQPLFGPLQTVLIANGEIYNNPELRRALADVPFKTQSDCEPPLFLYQRHGLDFVMHLRGMYALALFDASRRRLILCRDPFGIKPLYYAETAEAFLFASEPQALLASGLVPRRELDRGRDELINLQFGCGRQTIFAGIERVAPGETLVVESGRIVARHQRDALSLAPPRHYDEPDALAELDRLLTDSVLVHQRADVPYGMFLSGGIDSATLLALMARLNSRPVIAFTACFPDSLVPDESALAARLAAQIGATHVEVPFFESDFWSMLPSVAAAMDDPAADYAILPTAKLAQVARQSVKVVLSGEGGDELFAGYGRYRAAARPWPFGRSMRRHALLAGLGVLRDEHPDWRRGMGDAEAAVRDRGLTALQQAQAVDCRDWLPNDLLGKLDRCLMRSGVEGRVPMLDLALANLAFHLPDALKIRRGRGKYLLRRWLQAHLADSLPFARKRGFTVPVSEWLAAKPQLGTLLAAQPAIKALCRPGAVEALFTNLDRRKGAAAWTLLFYALWHRCHIEGGSVEGGVFECLG